MKRLVVLAVVLFLVAVATPTAAFTVSGTFTDDDGSVHEPDIQAIAEIGVTNGCGPSLYCPTAQVTREQMASFLVRALGLTPLSSGPFIDLLPNVHAGDINALVAAGITLGCDTNRFCPTEPVLRDQMASFLARAFALAPAADFGFIDVPDVNPHAADIDAIAAEGITVGCGPAVYCPTEPVLRDQMASFLRRSLNLEQSFVRLPLFEGLPLECTKDGFVCTATLSLPNRTQYSLEESLYQVLPASEQELAALRSSATRVEIVLDGIRFILPAGEEIETATRVTIPFESQLTLVTGSHTIIAQWFLEGSLIQTIELRVAVG